MLRSVGWLSTDVSGLLIGPILDTRPLKVRSIGRPETSVVNQPALRNIAEDGRAFPMYHMVLGWSVEIFVPCTQCIK
jgi:hypothetical protein